MDAGIQGMQVTIKGTRDGLLITLGPGDMEDLLNALRERVASHKAFFQGGQAVLQFGERALVAQDVMRALQVLQENGVAVRAIYAHQSIRGQDFHPPAPVAQEESQVPRLDDDPRIAAIQAERTDPVLVQRTLRSGQSIRHAGHVVVVGDVNAGAEVIAGGDIIVWGRLRGIVHAGAMGDDERCICALDLSPTQLRIGNYIARPPEDRPRHKGSRPERAFVSNGQIVAETCT